MAKKTVKKVASAKKASDPKGADAQTPDAKSTPVKKTPAKKVVAKKAVKKAAKKPVKRTRPAKEVRLKAFWGVFNQSLRRIALFEFNQRKQAEKKAEELTKNGKSPHFVQPVKEVIEG